MSSAKVQLRLSTELKEEAESVLKDMGMSVPEAVRLFLKQVVNARSLPFLPVADQVITNQETLQAVAELDKGEGKTAPGAEALFNDLGI